MYVDAHYNKEGDKVFVLERVNGERVEREFPADYTFYMEDPRGKYMSIFNKPLMRHSPKTSSEFAQLKAMNKHKKLYESDINAVSKCLEQNYLGADYPDLHVAFFDIETDFDKDIGYSTPDEAQNRITSIAVYLQWLKRIVCIAVPPKTTSFEDAQKIAEEVGNTIIVRTEKEMLQMFIALVEDADVLSGWNSEFFDIPYTINRIISQLGKHEAKKLSPWLKAPKKRKIERGGRESVTYDLMGKVHMDYLQLYKKYNYEERHSYALDSIAEAELSERKVAYEGTLDQLYNYDFKKFLEYNIQDTMLLDKLDRKLKFIDLASTIAHTACVLLPATMGAVAVSESAINIEAHKRGMIVPDKCRDEGRDTRAAGGWVSHPVKGLHKWVGSVDLNSLYPSTIRALNMSPETIWAQIKPSETLESLETFINERTRNTFAEWWNDRFNIMEMDNFYDNENSEKLDLVFEDGSTIKVTGAELRQLIFASGEPLCISANGTIFRTDVDGIIPSLLKSWYDDRVIMKGKLKTYIVTREKGIDLNGIELNLTKVDKFKDIRFINFDALKTAIADNNEPAISDIVSNYGLVVKDGKLYPGEDILAKWKDAESYWDKQQLVKKISLNSIYGALLNEHCRYFDQRLGQSTTLTGRSITKHMTAQVNKIITGEYDAYGKAIIYNDTDSAYFSAYPILKEEIESGALPWETEDVVNLYDNIASEMNKSFPDFMLNTFNVPKERSTGVIAAGREIVAVSGLYIVKKRYAALVVDDEGERKDVDGKPGKLKAMGLDLRRADTPVKVQQFLQEILLDVLTGAQEEETIEKIREFKAEFDSQKPWMKGSPKAVNGVTKYLTKQEEYMADKAAGRNPAKVTIPGHVRGSHNWNYLRAANNDLHTQKIVDGQKVIVCYLKENPHKFTSIAYPVDEPHLPDWFTELPFDEEKMMATVVDKKVSNLLTVLKWDLSRTSKDIAHMESLFEF